MAEPKDVSYRTLLVAAGLLALVAIGSGIAALYQFMPAADDTNGVAERLGDLISNYHTTYHIAIPFASIVLAVQASDPKERTVTATIQADFFDNSLPNSIPELINSDGHVIDPQDSQFTRSALTLTLYCWPSGEVVTSFPLSRMSQPLDQYAQINIPVEATPQSFPHDRYNLTILYATLTTPEGTWLRYHYKTAKGEQVARTNYWPIGLGIAWGDHLVDWRLNSSLAVTSKQSSNDYSVDVSSQLARPISLILFVYSIALAPALLGLSYWLRARRKGGGDDGMSPLELGAAFIALLALRQVLIPSDIPGITLLDRFLGIEIVLLVAIAVATLPRRSRSLDASVASGEHPEIAGTSSWRPVIIMLVSVTMLWRWFRRLRR
jgi:hypothetical protein